MHSAPCRILSIAVTPLVKRIILDSTAGKPLYLSSDHRRPFNPYAEHLHALLEKPQKDYKDTLDREAGLSDLTEKLEVSIPDWYDRRGMGTLISPARQLAFNHFVTRTFRQRMRDEIAIRMETSATLKKAVENTLRRWGVPEDLYPMSAAIRHYNRHQE